MIPVEAGLARLVYALTHLVGEPRVSRGRDDRELLRPQGGATLVWDRRNRARL